MGGAQCHLDRSHPAGAQAAHQRGEDPLALAHRYVLEDQERVHEVVGAAQLAEPLGGTHSTLGSPMRAALRAASRSIEGDTSTP